MNVFIWHKTNGVCYNPKAGFAEHVELGTVLYKLGARFTFNNNKRIHPNIYSVGTTSNSKERLEDGFHPTQNPLKLINYLIQLFSNEGDVVLEPFAGKGTTIASAFKHMRKGITFEKDPYFFKATKQRLDKLEKKVKPFVQPQKIKGLLF